MNINSRSCLIALITIISAASLTSLADGPHEDDDNGEIKLFSQAKFSLIDAIEIAQKASHGNAISGEFENIHGSYSYSIELLLPDGSITEIAVDSSTGKLIEDKH